MVSKKNQKVKAITKKELMKKLKLLKPKTKEERNKLVCVLIGHSKIISGCWGYIHCGRCEDQIGDTLAGVFDGGDCVLIDHNCKTCRKNYKKLNWRDMLYCPDPFKKRKKSG